MLRGLNKVENCIAIGVEMSLPYSTTHLTGWHEVTPERKKICRESAKAAAAQIKAAGYVIVKRQPK